MASERRCGGAVNPALVLLVGLLAIPIPALAGDLVLEPALTDRELRDLGLHLAEAIEMPSSPVSGLGRFEGAAGAFWVNADDGASWWRHSLSGVSATLGGLTGYRAFVRVGLPHGLGVGAQVGSVAGESFWSGEVAATLISGGALVPHVGARLVWSRLASGPVALDAYTAQVTAAKSFAVVTAYAAAGARQLRTAATWGEPEPEHHSASDTQLSLTGGVRVALPPFGVLAEVRHSGVGSLFLGAALRL